MVAALTCGLAAAAATEPAVADLGWSRAVSIGTTAVEARPALVVDPADRVQVFFIDREAGGGILRWVTAGLDGRIIAGPVTLGEADLRARSVAAAVDGAGVRVVWVAPSGENMRVLSTRIGESAAAAPLALSDAVEDAGPVSLAPSAGSHAAWSQASAGRRSIWYQDPGQPPAEVAEGDAPTVAVGPAGPWIVWWQRVGFDTYRLVAASMRAGVRSIHILTGNLATARLQAPAAAHDAAGRLYVVFGTEQRGFGPAVGRLSHLDVRPDGRPSPRRVVAPGSPFAGGATAVPWRGAAAFAWADRRSGRSRNPEIYVGIQAGTELTERRLTYTLTASALPVLAAGPGSALTAGWLEVAPGGRFTLHLASTLRPVVQRFLLDIPELDVSRPLEAAAFALTAVVGTLPYSVMVTLFTTLVTTVAMVVGRAVLADTRPWLWLAASGTRAGVATLALALACQGLATTVLPLIPRLPVAAAACLLVLTWGWLRLRRTEALSSLQLGALVMSVVFGTSVALAFGQVARTLSQLSA
ncbi:MAG: hypothetical protein ACT4PY_01790 [Armatimonadota bacterium]